MSSSKITHVIFDMDGLLLDTEGFYTIVQKKILSRFGIEFTWALKAKMMGKKALEAGRILISECGLQGKMSAEEFISEREKMLHDLFPNSELMPGAERLIRHLCKHNIPMAIATSSHKAHFDLKTKKHTSLFSFMDNVVVGDDAEVKLGKPSPDIFLVAHSRFKKPSLDTKNVLVFEDAPSGVEAALNAKMSVVMVPHPELDKSLCEKANQVIMSLNDFDPTYWGLPPFEDD